MYQVYTLPNLTLESGQTYLDVPVAFASWGTLNPRGDNAIVVCHALTGNTEADDWWATHGTPEARARREPEEIAPTQLLS